MPTQLFFSNTIEAVIRSLADEISQHRDPFNPVTIITPNPYMQKWMQLKLAEFHGITMNLNFHVLNEGLKKMLDYFNPHDEKPSLLEQKQLQLLLFHAIGAINPKNPLLQFISDYMYTDGTARKEDYDHRLWQLSSRLSRYFLEYELYRDEMVQSWLKGHLILNTSMESAQQYLYHALFKRGGYRDSINKNWLTLPQYFARSVFHGPAGSSPKLLIFGESHLSPLHAKIIFELGKYLSLSLYQLNPCSEFWEDITTPGEDRWQRVRSIGIERTSEGDSLNYNDDENPLLKLWGKTGRETIKLLSLIEEAGSGEQGCTSEWIAFERSNTGNTVLGITQDQILRRTTHTNSPGNISQDTSIQIASCPDVYREVESVYNSILYNLEYDNTLRMTDIAVMVPDMELYGPVIHSVFSRKPHRLAYSMIDSTATSDSMFAKAVSSLFEIATGSFTRKEISGLLRNPCFYEAHDLTLADALVWISWADKLNVYREYKKSDEPDPDRNLYTWKQGLLRLRLGRIMDSRPTSSEHGRFLSYKNIVPYSDINTGDQRLVDAISSIIELIYARTSPLRALEASASEWVRLITDLITEFLTIPADKPEENRVRSKLLESLNSVKILDRFTESKSVCSLTITAMQEFITDTLTGIPSTQGSYLSSGINISALIPKRQIPFSIVYIIGMQEGFFPGSSDRSTLNLMAVKRKIGDLSRPDVNRYHFLEILLSAREKLYITYISRDLQKDQVIHPNSVIGQLVTYLSDHVIDADFIISEIPSSGSSLDYLRCNPQLLDHADFMQATINGKFQPVQFNESERLVLLKRLLRTKSLPDSSHPALSQKIQAKTPDFSISINIENEISETESISLNDLRHYFLNPVESILRRHLSVYDDFSEDISDKEHEPFFSVFPYNYNFIMDSLNHCIITKSASELRTYVNQYYQYSKLMGYTPHSAFADIDFEKLNKTLRNRLEGADRLIEFLENRDSFPVYHSVTFGSIPLSVKPDLSLPPVILSVKHRNSNITIELKGSLPVLWKDPVTDRSETLIITGSAQPSILHLVYPFLFYVVSASNCNTALHDLVGSEPFTIHVSHLGGISSYSYHLSESDCRTYLDDLIDDFLNKDQLDLLPLPIISDKKLIAPSDMMDNPSEVEIADYRQSLVNLIDDDADKMNPLYRPMPLTQLINAEVPADAYFKVRDRLGILFKSFTGGDIQ